LAHRALTTTMQARAFAKDVHEEMAPIVRVKPDAVKKTVDDFVNPPEPKVESITLSNIRVSRFSDDS
jgi:hypothetical protein